MTKARPEKTYLVNDAHGGRFCVARAADGQQIGDSFTFRGDAKRAAAIANQVVMERFNPTLSDIIAENASLRREVAHLESGRL